MITNELISEIKSKINDNHKQAITGGILQGVLVDMVKSLCEVYPQTYTDEEKAQARANIDALSNYDGEIAKEKLSLEVQAILNDVANKQNISDATLATIAKTIVGAINEVYKGGLEDASIATSKIKDGAITEPKLDTDLVNIITSAVQPAELASAIATALTSYVAKADIVDTTGSATDKVMSQHGATEAIDVVTNKVTELENKISEVETSSATSSDDSIEIVDNGGETIVSVTSEGVDAKEITIRGGSLMKEKDYEIEKIIKGDISNKIEITQDNGDEIVSITPSGINAKEVSVRVGNKYHSLSKNASKSELAFCRAENNFIFPTSTLRDDSVILYKANLHSSNDSHIVNAVSYPNGEIIAAKSDGTIIKIGNDGQETNLLTISNSNDWRCLFINSNLDVFASPAGSSVSSTNRGLYKLAYNGESFTKVISLYNPSSSIESETIDVNSSIWTMCEDNKGYLYAGVYQNQTPWNPAIYRSTDGGDTWVYLYNFITSGVCPSGHHIHFVTFNKADMRLYAIVGEYNDVFVSEDSGVSWNSLGVVLKDAKGSAAVPCDSGLVIGSDSAYSCLMHKVYTDKSYDVKSRIWANVVFAVRKSDLTGWLYAFTINDASVDSLSYMPPVSAIESEDALNSWKASSPAHLAEWEEYNEMTKDVFPDDAIRPQHCAILISKNDGETWEILYRPSLGTKGGVGFPIAGTFRNGECLVCVQKQEGNQVVIDAPIIISEGVHKYTSNGISVEDRIFSKVVSSNNITRI